MQKLAILLLFLCTLLSVGFSAPYTTRDFFNAGGSELKEAAKMEQEFDLRPIFLSIFKELATNILSKIPSKDREQQKKFLANLMASKERQIKRQKTIGSTGVVGDWESGRWDDQPPSQRQKLQKLQAKGQQSLNASGNFSADSGQILPVIVNMLVSAFLNG